MPSILSLLQRRLGRATYRGAAFYTYVSQNEEMDNYTISAICRTCGGQIHADSLIAMIAESVDDEPLFFFRLNGAIDLPIANYLLTCSGYHPLELNRTEHWWTHRTSRITPGALIQLHRSMVPGREDGDLSYYEWDYGGWMRPRTDRWPFIIDVNISRNLLRGHAIIGPIGKLP